MGPEDLADLEGEAAALLSAAGEQDERVPRLLAVAHTLGVEVVRAPGLATEGRLEVVDGRWRALVRRGLPPARARWVVGHELAEAVHLRAGYVGADIEARCDAMGAMLVAPRAAFRREVRDIGRHAVHELARRFRTTQSVALLRIGEVTGRPVMLQRWPEPIVRGAAFGWPSAQRPQLALDPLSLVVVEMFFAGHGEEDPRGVGAGREGLRTFRPCKCNCIALHDAIMVSRGSEALAKAVLADKKLRRRVAFRCDVSEQSVRNWAAGSCTPTYANRVGLRDAVGIGLDDWDLPARPKRAA